MKTYSAKPDDIRRDWYVIDGTDQVLGRLATEIVKVLSGKGKTSYAPHIDAGDIVITALPYQVSGNRILEQIAAQMRDKKLPWLEDLRDEEGLLFHGGNPHHLLTCGAH